MGGASEPAGRQKAKSLQMHNTIVDAVVDCLNKHGYAATSISRVLEQADVSRGALQHHFRSKEDLIAATAEHLMHRSLAVMAAPGVRTRRSLRRELQDLWSNLIHTREYLALLEILNAIRTDLPLRIRIRPILEDWNAAIDQEMVKLYKSNTGKDAAVIEIMTMSRCLLRGLVIHESFSVDPGHIDSIIKRWIDMVSVVLNTRTITARGSE